MKHLQKKKRKEGKKLALRMSLPFSVRKNFLKSAALSSMCRMVSLL